MKLPQRLPHLQGSRGRAVRIVYLVLAAATVLLLAGNLWFTGMDTFINAPSSARFGFRTHTTPNGARVAGISSQAQAAGMRAGDQILSIQGRAIAGDADEFAVGRRLASERGPHLALIVRGDSGPIRAVELAARPDVWTAIDSNSGVPLWLYAFVLMAMQPQLVLLFVSLALFRRRSRDPEAMIFAFGFLLLNWQFDSFWWIMGFSPLTLHLADLGGLGWCASFIGVAAFPDGRLPSRLSRLVAVGGVALAAMAVGIGISRQIADAFELGLLLLVVPAAVSVMLRYRSTPPGLERQQIKWAVAGFCLSASVVLLFVPLDLSGLLQNRGDAAEFLALRMMTEFGYAALPLGLLISLMRYRLYDAEAAVSRSVAFGSLALGLVAIFACSEKVVELLGEQYFGQSMGALAGGLGAAAAAVMIAPLHRRVSRWTERRFNRNLLKLRQDLPLLVGDLRETANVAELAEVVLDWIGDGVRACRAALLIDGELIASQGIGESEVSRWCEARVLPSRKGLDCNPADPLFPLRLPLESDGRERVGWVLLGPRPDGSFYGRDERRALLDVGGPIARALQVVLLRQRREQAQARRLDRLERGLKRAQLTIEGLRERMT